MHDPCSCINNLRGLEKNLKKFRLDWELSTLIFAMTRGKALSIIY